MTVTYAYGISCFSAARMTFGAMKWGMPFTRKQQLCPARVFDYQILPMPGNLIRHWDDEFPMRFLVLF
jgi:hypothetical protein